MGNGEWGIGNWELCGFRGWQFGMLIDTFAQNAVLATFQYDGCTLLHGELEGAIARFGAPEIFNSDQGS